MMPIRFAPKMLVGQGSTAIEGDAFFGFVVSRKWVVECGMAADRAILVAHRLV